MTSASIYLRISRDFTGEQLGVARQREDCTALAERRGWDVGTVHTDNDISAAGGKRRPAFEALLNEIGEGTVQAVIAYSLDRLTRNARDRLRLLEVGKAHGLVLALVRGSDLDLSTPAGRLTAELLGSVAQHEIEQKGERQARAALQRSQQGKPPLGVRLTGYTPSGDLVPDEARVIRDLFERCAAGDSLRALAEWLTSSGLSPRHEGGRWNPSTVRGLLVNPRFAGRAIYRGAVTGERGIWAPLVDDETFDVVQALLTDPRRRTHQGTDRRHLGSGLYRCGLCQKQVHAWSGVRYRCPDGCVNRSGRNVDEYVMQTVRAFLGHPDLADVLARGNEPAQQAADALVALRARLAAIGADYDSGLIDGQRYSVATEKVRSEIAVAEGALARASAGRAASILTGPDPAAAFEVAPLMLRRSVLDLFFRVELHPAPRGSKRFDPATVVITPQQSPDVVGTA